jgi:hypothetical protein
MRSFSIDSDADWLGGRSAMAPILDFPIIVTQFTSGSVDAPIIPVRFDAASILKEQLEPTRTTRRRGLLVRTAFDAVRKLRSN